MTAQALIFDFDGVIVNTEPLHYRAFQEVLVPENLGYPWEDYVAMYLGFDDREAVRARYRHAGRVLEDARLADLLARKAVAFARIAAHASVKPLPGVAELIASVRGRIPLAVCSGAVLSDIEPVLRSIGILDAFSVIVTADDVAASKPDPTCYVLAVKKLNLGLEARECLAIEDTPAGIQAAKGAGLRVVAVTNTYGREKLFGADRIVNSLEELRL